MYFLFISVVLNSFCFGLGRIKYFGGSWHALVMSFFTCLSRERVVRALFIDRHAGNAFSTAPCSNSLFEKLF